MTIRLSAFLWVALSACSDTRQADQVVSNAHTAALAMEPVDTILGVEESIRRFTASLPPGERVTHLSGGAKSRDELVARFVRAVEANDSSALRAMALTAQEFIDLYYPHSQYTTPPFQLGPDLVWLMLSENGEKGYRRLTQRVAGRPLGYRGYECGPEILVQEKNRIIENCTLELSSREGSPSRLFSAIIEREDQFKIMSYANDM